MTPNANAPPATRGLRAEYVPSHPAELFIVPLLRDWIGKAIDEWGKPAGGSAIDVGCGRQPFRGLIESKGLRYRSLDFEQHEVATVDFLAPIDGELPRELLVEAPFDLVLCTEVLEHVADWPAAFANLRRLAGDRGTVLVTCPQVYMLHYEPYDFWRPTDHALRYYAAKYGFRVERLDRLGGPREVAATVLEFCTFKPKGDGRLAYLYSRALNAFKRLGLMFLHSRLSWAGSVALTGPTYLCNAVVMRPNAGEAPS